jgi:hypothetical protein
MERRWLAIAALAWPMIVQAAAVTNPIVGCKSEGDSKRLFALMAKNDAAQLEKFKTSKIAAGDCSSFLRGMSVDVDKKDGEFLCVRPTGGFECFWTAAVGINQNPANSENSTGSRPRGRGRGGGRTPQF